MHTDVPQQSLTAVLLPSGPLGLEALEVARSWAAEGLLKRALWIPADAVEPSPYGGASIAGFLLDQGQEQHVDALTVMASSRLSLLTLVVLRVSLPDQPADAKQGRAAALLEMTVGNARPQLLRPSDGTEPIALVTINLIAGPTGMSRVPYGSVVPSGYGVTLFASPEDRRAADQMDQFVRPEENLVPWATAQASTIGGLWAGMPEGPWRIAQDRAGGDVSSLSQGDFVKPVRSFARIVTSAPTARRALALAMEEVRFQQANVLASQQVLKAMDASPMIEQTLTAFDGVDGGRIGYVTPAETALAPPAKVAFLAAAGKFLVFSAKEIVQVPRFVAQRFGARMSKQATQALSGADGAEVVTFRGESPDISIYLDRFERQAIEARTTLSNAPVEVLPAAPQLWRTLRGCTFALLDGSAMPDSIPPLVVASQRVVVPSTTLVVPLPDSWGPEETEFLPTNFAEGHDIRSCAPWEAEVARAELGSLHGEREAAVSQAQADLADAEATLATALAVQSEMDVDAEGIAVADSVSNDALDAGDGVGGTDPDDDSDEGRGADQEDSGDAADDDVVEDDAAGREATEADAAVLVAEAAAGVHRAHGKVDETRESLAAVERVRESLDEWVRGRESALLWRLAKRVQDRTLQAKADRAAFYELAVDVPSMDADEPRRARNQFANRFLLLFTVGALLSWVVAKFGNSISQAVSVPKWVVWVALGVLLLIWLFLVLAAYYRRRSRFLKVLADLSHRQRDAVRRCREATQAEARLSGLYVQLVDWGEILSYSVHDPWRPEPSWFTGLPAQHVSASLPACVDLAVPDPDDELGTSQLQDRALASIAGEGWRARTFEVLLDGLLARRVGAHTSDEASLIDLDTPAAPNGTRRQLLDLLRSGELQARTARDVLASKAAGLYAERDTLMSHALKPVNSEYAGERTDLLDTGRELAMLRPAWGDFLAGGLDGSTQFSIALWSSEGRDDGATRYAMETVAFAPAGLRTNHLPSDAVVIPTASADRNRGVELAARCDFGPSVEQSALLFFSDDDLSEDGEGIVSEPEVTAGRHSPPVAGMDVAFFN